MQVLALISRIFVFMRTNCVEKDAIANSTVCVHCQLLLSLNAPLEAKTTEKVNVDGSVWAESTALHVAAGFKSTHAAQVIGHSIVKQVLFAHRCFFLSRAKEGRMISNFCNCRCYWMLELILHPVILSEEPLYTRPAFGAILK